MLAQDAQDAQAAASITGTTDLHALQHNFNFPQCLQQCAYSAPRSASAV